MTKSAHISNIMSVTLAEIHQSAECARDAHRANDATALRLELMRIQSSLIGLRAVNPPLFEVPRKFSLWSRIAAIRGERATEPKSITHWNSQLIGKAN